MLQIYIFFKYDTIPLIHILRHFKHYLPRGFHIHLPVPPDFLAQNSPHFTVFNKNFTAVDVNILGMATCPHVLQIGQ